MGKNRRRHRRPGHKKAASSSSSPVDDNGGEASNDVSPKGDTTKGEIRTDVRVVDSWSSLPWRRAEGATLPEPSLSSSSAGDDADKKTKKKKGKKRPRPADGEEVTIRDPFHDAGDDDGEVDSDDPDDSHHHSGDDEDEVYGGDDDEPFAEGYNHYDDPDADPTDLWNPQDPSSSWSSGAEGAGADDPGILMGLEVVDGAAYEVRREEGQGGTITKLIIRGEGDSKDEEAGDADRNGEDDDNEDDEEAKMKSLKAEMRKLKRKEAKLRRKKRKREEQQKKAEQGGTAEASTNDDGKDGPSKKAKKKKIDKKEPSKASQQDQDQGAATAPSVSPEALSSVRSSWLSPTGVYLHPALCAALASRKFYAPTPVQSATLAASVLGRRDVVGAAPTGSGKTLAYGLPVLQGLLEERDAASEKEKEDEVVGSEEEEAEGQQRTKTQKGPLAALILTPTRELALQVTAELKSMAASSSSSNAHGIEVCAVVGGMAEAKQTRLLGRRPEVVVGTPGRLWELMSKEEHPHLSDLTSLRYLVIDEADRLIGRGSSFPQLSKILEAVRRANPPPPDPEELLREMEEEDDSDSEDEGRLKGVAGVRGEARVTMLSPEILEEIERWRNGDGGGEDDGEGGGGEAPSRPPPEPQEMDDDEYERLQAEMAPSEDEFSSDDDEEEEEDEEDEEEERVHRQTFVYSATLTLPPSQHWTLKTKQKGGGASMEEPQSKKQKKRKKNQNRKRPASTVEGAIAEMLDLAGSMGKVKVVDLAHRDDSHSKAGGGGGNGDGAKKSKKGEDGVLEAARSINARAPPRLPPGLVLREVRCAQRRKDSHLYAVLLASSASSQANATRKGPALVFCNSVAAVRRVGETLRVLGMPVKTIHAKMAQKARLSALDSVKSPESESSSSQRQQQGAPVVVVATDVAARGLDLPSVSTVVHYDAARAVDTFIHRAGRTARGVGENAVGTSVSLVSPAEDAAHRKICEAVLGGGRGLGGRRSGLEEASLDGWLLSESQARVALASKIVSCEEVQTKASRDNRWFADAAADAGLDLDEDLLDGGLADGDRKDRQRLVEAGKARAELRELLKRPMRKQTFGKFLAGGGGAAEAVRGETEVAQYALKPSTARGKKSKKRRRK